MTLEWQRDMHGGWCTGTDESGASVRATQGGSFMWSAEWNSGVEDFTARGWRPTEAEAKAAAEAAIAALSAITIP